MDWHKASAECGRQARDRRKLWALSGSAIGEAVGYITSAEVQHPTLHRTIAPEEAVLYLLEPYIEPRIIFSPFLLPEISNATPPTTPHPDLAPLATPLDYLTAPRFL
jgi:hypothetical protein